MKAIEIHDAKLHGVQITSIADKADLSWIKNEKGTPIILVNANSYLIQEVLEHLVLVISADAEVVFDLFHGLASVHVDHCYAAAGGVGAPALAAADVPGVADHEFEVVVLVDGGAQVCVVLAELLRAHLTILLHCVEGIQELTMIVRVTQGVCVWGGGGGTII